MIPVSHHSSFWGKLLVKTFITLRSLYDKVDELDKSRRKKQVNTGGRGGMLNFYVELSKIWRETIHSFIKNL